MNSHLSRVGCKIQDLYVDLRDGKMLIKLLEVLSGERLVCVKWIKRKHLCTEYSLCSARFVISYVNVFLCLKITVENEVLF